MAELATARLAAETFQSYLQRVVKIIILSFAIFDMRHKEESWRPSGTHNNHKDNTMSRRPKPIELETTIIANDPDALQAWTDATELLFRLKARRQARLAQGEKDGQGQQEQSKMESHS